MANLLQYVGITRESPSTSSWTVTYPAASQAGDLIIYYHPTGGGSMNTPSGWTAVGTSMDRAIFYRFRTTDTSQVFTATQAISSTYGYMCVAYRGVVNSAALRGVADSTGGSAPIPAYTPTVPAATFFLSHTYNNFSPAQNSYPSTPSGWTRQYELTPTSYVGNPFLFARMDEPANVSAPDPGFSASTNSGAIYYAYLSFQVQANTLPAAPTNVTLGARVGNNIPVTWTHNDPDSNPQSKYKFRWRKVI